jgi:hypothetical protein
VAEVLEVGEPQLAVHPLGRHALVAQALRPEVQRRLGAHPRDDGVDHAGARPAGDRAGVLEERQLRAGPALLVGVEQVVDARIVLVDGLGDHPQAHDPRVEVEVALRIAGDRRDVVDAFESHSCTYNYSKIRRARALPQV